MATYVRQSSFSDGDTITAALFNNEFNQLVNAFDVATGHTHDGSTAGDGGPISNLFSNALVFGTNTDNDVVITFNANSNDGVLTWMEDEDYFQFSDDLLLTTTEKVQFRDTAIYINSSTDGQLDIVADTEVQIAATTIDMNGNADISGNLGVGGNLTVTGTTTFNGGTITMGDAATDNVVFGADVDSNIIPDDDDSYDLGSSTQEWRNLYIDGTANIDSLVADTADINGGTIDAANITVGSGKTLDVSAGTLTLADNQISGDKVEGGTINATTINTLTYGSITDGTITVTAFVDEDNMASNSATLIPTQQSVKAYVDAQDTAQDLDLVSDSGTIAIDLDGETLTVTGGEGIDTSASSNTLTITGEDATTSNKGIASFNSDDFNVSSGAVTLATTSTAEELNLLDGTTAGTIVASKGVAVDANKDITGFRNITLTGELDAGSLDVSGNVDVDGTLETDALSINGTAVTSTAAELNILDGKAFLDEDNMASNSATGIASQQSIKAYVDTTVAATNEVVEDTTPQLGGDLASNGNDILFADNDKAIFGADSDLQIYHDGSNTYINESGTGSLYLKATNLTLGDSAGEQYVVAYSGGSVNLYHDNAQKLATASGGITVTGVVTATSLDISGDIDVDGTTNLDVVDIDGAVDMATTLTVGGNTTVGGNLTVSGVDVNITANVNHAGDSGTFFGFHGDDLWRVATGGVERLEVGNSGIIINDGGGDADFRVESDGNANMLFVDGGNDRVGVGLSNPSATAHIQYTTQATGNQEYGLVINGDDAGTNGESASIYLGAISNTVRGASIASELQSGSNNHDLIFSVSGPSAAPTERLRIASDGSATFTGAVTANAGVVVDTMTLDGSTLTSTGDFIVDAAADIIFDADANDVLFKDGGTEYFRITNNGTTFVRLDAVGDIILDADGGDIYLDDGGTGFGQISGASSNLTIKSSTADKDIIFQGNDGGSSVTALTLDMSAAGAASFNAGVTIDSTLLLSPDGSNDLIKSTGGVLYLKANELSIQDNNGNQKLAIDTNILLDTGGIIVLDADNAGVIQLKDGGGHYGSFFTSSDSFNIQSNISDGDIIFKGNDGGSAITALTLDMSNAGKAAFNAGATFNSNVAITTADNSDTLTLVSTDADASAGPILVFDRTSSSPADNDLIGQIVFQARNDAGQDTDYAAVKSYILDASDGTEDGQYNIETMVAGTLQTRLLVASNEIVLNESSIDTDFRVESNGNANMLFVDGGNDRVGIGAAPTARTFEVNSGTANTAARFTSTDSRSALEFVDSSGTASIGNLGDHLTFLPAGVQLMELNNEGGLTVTPTAGGHTVFNSGAVDADFQVKSDGNANMLFVDGGNNIVSIGSSSVYQSGLLEVFAQSDASSQGISINGASSATSFRLYTVGDVAKIGRGGDNPAISISTGNAVTINENSLDADFRVESNGNANMLFVDGGNDLVKLGNDVFGEAPTVSSGNFVHFNTGAISVSSNASSTVNLFTRSPNSEVSACGTVFVAGENSGGSIQFGVIIDFFFSNGSLSTTARETGSSQGTVTTSVQENGAAISVTVAYGGGLGGAIRYSAGGQAAICSY